MAARIQVLSPLLKSTRNQSSGRRSKSPRSRCFSAALDSSRILISENRGSQKDVPLDDSASHPPRRDTGPHRRRRGHSADHDQSPGRAQLRRRRGGLAVARSMAAVSTRQSPAGGRPACRPEDKSFCSGADLTALDQLASLGESTLSSGELKARGAGPMGGSRLIQVKPVITVAQGYCLRWRPRAVLPWAHPPGRAASHVLGRLSTMGCAARGWRHRLPAAPIGLGKCVAADYHGRAHQRPSALIRSGWWWEAGAARARARSRSRYCSPGVSATTRRAASRSVERDPGPQHGHGRSPSRSKPRICSPSCSARARNADWSDLRAASVFGFK